MQRPKSQYTHLALNIPCGGEKNRLIAARAVEMTSCAQPVRANRRAHRLNTGLGKLAKKGYCAILKFSTGEFPTIPQPHHHYFCFFKRGKSKLFPLERRKMLDPNGTVGVA
jgi:hypothetical protein